MIQTRVFSCLLAAMALTSCGDAAPAGGSAASVGEAPSAAAPAPQASVQPASPSVRDPVGLAVEATIGGRAYRAKGVGECTHTAQASIYDVAAAQTRASYSADAAGALEHLNLTLWQPNSGGPLQFSLAVRAGSAEHQIATVKGGTLSGSGTALLQRDGPGGTLTVDGKDAGDTDLRVVVRCERFSEPVVEGG